MTDSHNVWHHLNPVSPNPKRAALYVRAATVSQLDGSSSIAAQKRADRDFCEANGWPIVEEYVDAPASGTDENRPEFQRMLNDAIRGAPRFELIVVQDHSVFFRNAVLAEIYRRHLLKAGVELVSTEEAEDKANGDFIRQVLSVLDEHSSRENARRALRGRMENARQGFVIGIPPFGYRGVVVETHGTKIKRRLAIEPQEAEIVKLIFRLANAGPTGSGPAGAMTIAKELSRQNLTTRSGRLFSAPAVQDVLHRTTYVGRHVIKLLVDRTKQGKPTYAQITVSVPPIIDETTFQSVQTAMRVRNPFRAKLD
jgi:site-specific DNA recombinase